MLRSLIRRLAPRRQPGRLKVTFSKHRPWAFAKSTGNVNGRAITPRPLTDVERRVIRALLERPFTGRDELVAQLDAAQVVGRCGCGCPTIDIAIDASGRAASLKYEPPVEAYVDDSGGHHEVVLHAKNGYLSELELITYATRPSRNWPDVSDAKLMVFDESPWSTDD